MNRGTDLPPLLPNEVDFYGFYHSTRDKLIPLKPRLCIKFAEFYRESSGTAKFKFQLFGRRCRINLKRRLVDLDSDEPVAVDGKVQFALIRLRENSLHYVSGYLERGESLPPDTGDQRLLGEEYVIHTDSFIVAVDSQFTEHCTRLFSEEYDRACHTDISKVIVSQESNPSVILMKLREDTKKCRIPVRFRVVRQPDKNFKAVNIEIDPSLRAEGFEVLSKCKSDLIPSELHDFHPPLKSAAIENDEERALQNKITNGGTPFDSATVTDPGNVATKGFEAGVSAKTGVCDVKSWNVESDSGISFRESKLDDDEFADFITPGVQAHPGVEPAGGCTFGRDLDNKRVTLGAEREGSVIFANREKNVFCVFDEKECEFYKVDYRVSPLELMNEENESIERWLTMGDEIEFVSTENRVISGKVKLIDGNGRTTAVTKKGPLKPAEEKGDCVFSAKTMEDSQVVQPTDKQEAVTVTDDCFIIPSGTVSKIGVSSGLPSTPTLSDGEDAPSMPGFQLSGGVKMTEPVIDEPKSEIEKETLSPYAMLHKKMIEELIELQKEMKKRLEYVSNLCATLLPQISRDSNQSMVTLDQLRQPLTAKPAAPKKRMPTALREQFDRRYDEKTGLIELDESDLYYSAFVEIAAISMWKVHHIESYQISDGTDHLFETVILVEYQPLEQRDMSDRRFNDTCVDESDVRNPVAFLTRSDDEKMTHFRNRAFVRSEHNCFVSMGIGRSSDSDRTLNLAAKNILPKLVSQSNMGVINLLLEKKLQVFREREKLAEAGPSHASAVASHASVMGESSVLSPTTILSDASMISDRPVMTETEMDSQHPKSFIFDFCQANKLKVPEKTEHSVSHDHVRPHWTATVMWNGERFEGSGSTKKEAEYYAYQRMRSLVQRRVAESGQM